jgi:hypothetical protein
MKRENRESCYNSETAEPGHPPSPRRGWGAAIAAVLLILTGCGTPRVNFGTRPAQPVESYRHTQTVGGLTIAGEPITDPAEVVRLLGTSLLKQDLFCESAAAMQALAEIRGYASWRPRANQ